MGCSSGRTEIDWRVSVKALVMTTSMIFGAIGGTYVLVICRHVVLDYTIVGCGLALLIFVNDEIFHKTKAKPTLEDFFEETTDSDEESDDNSEAPDVFSGD